MKRTLLLLMCSIVFVHFTVKAQTSISAELRSRPEFRYGYKQLPDSGSKAVFLISQRSRIYLNVKKEKYGVGFSLQDVRVWGDEQSYSSTGIQGDNASIDLKEAWFAYYINKEFSIKAGRQEFKYGDQRLLGARNWNQHGMSYDALLLSYKSFLRCDLGLSYNNNSDIYFQEKYATDKLKTLNFLYIQKEFKEKLDIYGLYVLTGMQNPNDAYGILFKNTVGASGTFKNEVIELNVNGYYQTGLNKDSVKVSAFLLGGYVAASAGILKFTLGAEMISGQNALSTDSSYLKTDHRFDNLYGGRHPFNGNMDLFSNFNSGTGGGGLNDVYFTVDCKINEKLALKGVYHYFGLQNNVPDSESVIPPYIALQSYLGSEIDLKLTCKVSDEIAFETGYSLMKGTKSLYAIRDSKADYNVPAQWVYIMVTFKPVFFTIAK